MRSMSKDQSLDCRYETVDTPVVHSLIVLKEM